MKQQQILGIVLVLLVQQVYFLAAVNSTVRVVSDPVRSDVTTETDPPTTKSTTAATTPPTPPTTTTTTPPPPTTTSTTTSTTPPPTTTTNAPTTTKPPPQPVQPRHFDLPSFIGGIVLTLGLIGISFVGHKIYKSKFDRNYHTL